MNKIIVENNAFIYTAQNEKRILLDCNDYLSNRSRIPMQSLEGTESIPKIILSLFREHLKLMEEKQTKNYAMEYLLLDIKIISYLMQSPLPVRVLELGCTSGVLSYHLATILGKFNQASSLCCVCDTIGNNSGNQWLDRISLVEELPGLSMLAADYDDTQLADHHFDIVVINGSVRFEQPYSVIKEAERLVKKSGLILCYAEEQPLLESSFQLLFAGREEFQLDAQTNIMAVIYEEASWGE